MTSYNRAMASRPASASAIEAIDHLLAGVGLKHGRRQILGTAYERQIRHPRQVPTSQTRPSRTRKTRLDLVTVPAFAAIDWLFHGFSTRTGGTTSVYRPEQRAGELNLGFTASDDPARVAQNRQRFFSAVTSDADFPTITLRQIHSSMVRRAGAGDAGPQAIHRGDGMMTSEPGVLLAIQTADCIPVLIADTRKRAIAAFHAGWRGTVKRIVENGVGRMRLEFGSRPADLVAAIGPGIGQCCYAVGEEVRSEFESQFAYAGELFCEVYDSDPVKEKYPLLFMTARAPGHSNIGPSLHLDLVEANRRQLLDAGLRAESISIVGDCTSCRTDRYFSHRAEHGFTGRMLSAIAIRP
jgi:polyphenol oxidase